MAPEIVASSETILKKVFPLVEVKGLDHHVEEPVEVSPLQTRSEPRTIYCGILLVSTLGKESTL